MTPEQISEWVLLIKTEGWWVAVIAFCWYLYSKKTELENELARLFRLYVRLSIVGNKNRLRAEDINRHIYFTNINKLINGASFNRVIQDDNPLDFKIYASDVVSYITHWLYKKYFTELIVKNDWANLDKNLNTILVQIGRDTLEAIKLCMNEEVALVYKDSTEVIRDVYCDLLLAAVSDDNKKYIGRYKAYVMLNMLNYRVMNSHTLLTRIFVGLNGRLESQASKVKILAKDEVEEIMIANFSKGKQVVNN
jgi:hypothetical protein